MRDAISILDTAIAGADGETVGVAAVREMIGRASPTALIDTLTAISSGDVGIAIAAWRRVISSGIDPVVALDDLMVMLHQACLAGIDANLVLEVGYSAEDAKRLAKIHDETGLGYLSGAQKMLFEMRGAAAANPSRTQAVEVLVMRLAAGFARKR
jgi:DNA polymerase III gamma/tau subunit